MTTAENGAVSTRVRRTAYAYVPTVAMFIGLADNIFSLLGIAPKWQRGIVFVVLISVPIVLAAVWILGKPKSGEGLLARLSRSRSRRLIVATVPTVVVAAALVWTVGPLAAGPTTLEPRVAVLQFRDDSPLRDHAYLARGLAEELALALDRVPGIQVLDAPDSAVVIIEGAVSRWQDRLRVTAKLLRNADKRRLRTVRYERPFGDVFAMQDSLSNDIVDELLPHMRSSQAKGVIAADPNPVAYDVYLRARYAHDVERDVAKADSLLSAAIVIDPSFARARRELATLRSLRVEANSRSNSSQIPNGGS